MDACHYCDGDGLSRAGRLLTLMWDYADHDAAMRCFSGGDGRYLGRASRELYGWAAEILMRPAPLREGWRERLDDDDLAALVAADMIGPGADVDRLNALSRQGIIRHPDYWRDCCVAARAALYGDDTRCSGCGGGQTGAAMAAVYRARRRATGRPE